MCLPAPGPGVSETIGPLEMAVSAASIDQRNVEGGLEGRLVEAGEGAARVGGLELGDGIVAARGFREIEAAQFVVEDARVSDGERGFAGGDRVGEGEGGLLLVLVEGDGGGLLLAGGGNGNGLKSDLGGVEGDGADRLFDGDFDATRRRRRWRL